MAKRIKTPLSPIPSNIMSSHSSSSGSSDGSEN
jgi:hypothetical protein